MLFMMVSEKMKSLGINLTIDVPNLYTENCRTLLRGTGEDINKGREVHGLNDSLLKH